MSSHLSLSTITEKNKIDSEYPFLACLEVDVTTSKGDLVETLYLVNNPEDFEYNDHTYKAFRFDLDMKSEAGQEPNVTVTIEDITGAVRQRMNTYGGGVGFEVRILVVSTVDTSLPPEIVEFFSVKDASADDYNVKWTLSSEMHLLLTFPKRRQLKVCQHAYKSIECGYVGEMPSCDFSLQGPNGCAAHGNSINFGGCPGINNQSG